MTDVVVVGGGAVGACAAYELRRAGARVTLVDRGEIGQECSLHNAGLIVPSHIVPLAAPGAISRGLKWMLDPESPFYIRPRLEPALFSWVRLFRQAATRDRLERSVPILRDLLSASRDMFDKLVLLPEFSFDLRARGLLALFRSASGEAVQREEAELAQRMGVEARILDPAGLAALEPGVRFLAGGGVYYPRDAHLDPERFMKALRAVLAQQGVHILTSRNVSGFSHDGRRITGVRLPGETLRAGDYVLAAGAVSPRLLGTLQLRLPMQAGKGYSVTVTTDPPPLSIPLILTEARVAVTPLDGAIRYAGTMELAGPDLSINRRRVNAIVKAVPRYLDGPEPRIESDTRLWAGLRPCTPDGLPYIGRFRRFPNLIAATGHAMLGITLAPVTGRLVAELIAEKPVSLGISRLAPDRFG